jgi:hypothetical protein
MHYCCSSKDPFLFSRHQEDANLRLSVKSDEQLDTAVKEAVGGIESVCFWLSSCKESVSAPPFMEK